MTLSHFSARLASFPHWIFVVVEIRTQKTERRRRRKERQHDEVMIVLPFVLR